MRITDEMAAGMLRAGGGNLDLRGTDAESLPDGLSVPGDLRLEGTGIRELPEGLRVGGDLYLEGTGVEILPDALIVGGAVRGEGSSLAVPAPSEANSPSGRFECMSVGLEKTLDLGVMYMIAIPGAGPGGASVRVGVRKDCAVPHLPPSGAPSPGLLDVRFPPGAEIEGVYKDGDGRAARGRFSIGALREAWYGQAGAYGYMFLRGVPEDMITEHEGGGRTVLVPGAGPGGEDLHAVIGDFDLFPAVEADGGFRLSLPGAGPEGGTLEISVTADSVFQAKGRNGTDIPGMRNVRFPAGSDVEVSSRDGYGRASRARVPAADLAADWKAWRKAYAPGLSGKRAAQAVAAMGGTACGVAAPDASDDPDYGG